MFMCSRRDRVFFPLCFAQNCWPRSLFGERFQKMSTKDGGGGHSNGEHQQHLPMSGRHLYIVYDSYYFVYRHQIDAADHPPDRIAQRVAKSRARDPPDTNKCLRATHNPNRLHYARQCALEIVSRRNGSS